MNRIKIENDFVSKSSLDETILLESKEKSTLFAVNSIHLNIIKDTELEITYEAAENTKLDINFLLEDNVTLKLVENKEGYYQKMQYRYQMGSNSHVIVNKISTTEKEYEYTTIYLKGENSSIQYVGKTISTTPKKQDFLVYHQASHTESSIINHGVNIDSGELVMNISSFVPKNKKGCKANQNSRIINFTNQNCLIHPNLFIDEYDVEANHSAMIGKFNLEEQFYMMSRGLTLEETNALLLQGFLKSDLTLIPEKQTIIEKLVNQYWR